MVIWHIAHIVCVVAMSFVLEAVLAIAQGALIIAKVVATMPAMAHVLLNAEIAVQQVVV